VGEYRQLSGIDMKIFTKRVFREVIADKIGLEQGTHLGITGTGMIQHHEVNFEGRHEDEDWNDYEANYSCAPMFDLISLWRWVRNERSLKSEAAYHRHFQVSEFVPKIFNSIKTNQSRDEQADHFDAVEA
jgi:hypothetical protein